MVCQLSVVPSPLRNGSTWKWKVSHTISAIAKTGVNTAAESDHIVIASSGLVRSPDHLRQLFKPIQGWWQKSDRWNLLHKRRGGPVQSHRTGQNLTSIGVRIVILHYFTSHVPSYWPPLRFLFERATNCNACNHHDLRRSSIILS